MIIQTSPLSMTSYFHAEMPGWNDDCSARLPGCDIIRWGLYFLHSVDKSSKSLAREHSISFKGTASPFTDPDVSTTGAPSFFQCVTTGETILSRGILHGSGKIFDNEMRLFLLTPALFKILNFQVRSKVSELADLFRSHFKILGKYPSSSEPSKVYRIFVALLYLPGT